MARTVYAALVAVLVLASAVVAPILVSRYPRIGGLENACIKDREQLRALLIEYNSSIMDEFRLLRSIAKPVAAKALASPNPFTAVSESARDLSEKYWADAARLILGVEKAYYAAIKYYNCTGDARGAATILAEVALNKPAGEIPEATIAQLAQQLKTMNASSTLATIKLFEKALREKDPTPVRSYAENLINYILLQELRSAILSRGA